MLFREALRLSCQSGEPDDPLAFWGMWRSSPQLTGDGERAARLLGMEDARRAELGLPLDEWDRKEREAGNDSIACRIRCGCMAACLAGRTVP